MSRQISPEVPVRLRQVRDTGALLFMLIFLGFLGYVIWDGLYMKGTDIDLIVHGHDSFGNICGRNNKPIKFSSKSGQNYSDRPYTKYTLVNSKFERYTGRMRFGELVYVKEQSASGPFVKPESNPQGHEQPYYTSRGALQSDLVSSATQISSFNWSERLRRGTSLANGNASIATRRGAPQEEDSLAKTATNGKAEFSDGSGSAASTRRSGEAAEAAAVVNPDAVVHKSRISDNRDDDNGRWISSRRRRATPHQQTEAPPLMHFDLVELARTNRSLFNALRSNMMYQYPPMYGYSSSSPTSSTSNERFNRTQSENEAHSGGGNFSARHHALNSTSLRAVNLGRDDVIRTSTSQPIVVFANGQATRRPPSKPTTQDGENEHYDHMFVTPRSVATTGPGQAQVPSSSTGLINQNEVTSQLLYLTECVESCPSDHVELIFYRCMPNNWRFSLFPNAINVTRTFIDDILTDVTHCRRELVYTFSLSLVLSLALLILLRFLASMIIWSCLTLLILIFVSMAGYSWLTFYHQIVDLEQMMPHDSVYTERLASSDRWLIGSIFLTFLAFGIIGTIIFMRKRILLVTTLFKESGKAIADMPMLLLQPLFTFAVLVLVMVVWVMGFICLQSMRMPVVDVHTGFVVYKTETFYKIMRWYHIFSFLWVSHFAIACQHYVIGASVSKWYFSLNRYQLGSPIGTSISELILYYLGTVALGSFLLAIFKVIRVITRQIQFLVQRSCMSPPLNSNQAIGGGGGDGHYLNSASGASPSSSTCGSLGYVWRLFIWFFDNIVMIINRDAYVEVAIHGHSFLGGARRAFYVLASNPLRLLAIKSVGNLLLVIAKICVVVGTISMAYMLLDGKSQQLNYAWSPIVISAVFAYIVAHWFLSVYEMVIDALFICYCEDYEQKNSDLNQAINGSNFRAQILNNGQIY